MSFQLVLKTSKRLSWSDRLTQTVQYCRTGNWEGSVSKLRQTHYATSSVKHLRAAGLCAAYDVSHWHADTSWPRTYTQTDRQTRCITVLTREVYPNYLLDTSELLPSGAYLGGHSLPPMAELLQIFTIFLLCYTGKLVIYKPYCPISSFNEWRWRG